MLCNQSQFDSVHIVAVVLTIFLPGQESFVLDVTVFEICLPEGVIFGLGGRLLGEALSFVL